MKKPIIFLFCFLLVFVAGGSGVAFFRAWQVTDNPFEMSQQFQQALTVGDMSTLNHLMSHQELEDNHMSNADFERFVKGWLQPRVAIGDKAATDTYGSGDNGFQTLSTGLITKRGRIPIAITVGKTDDGLRVVLPISSIVVTFAGLKEGTYRAGGVEKLRSYVANARKLAGELAQFHISTIRTGPGADPMTFEQFAQWSEDRLKSREELNR